MNLRYYFLLFLFFTTTLVAIAKDIPPRPNPPRLVNDFAGMFSPEEREALERKLVAYDDSTSTQIAVVIERSLEGDDVFDYALRIYNGWTIGQKDVGNGVLIFAALDDRKIQIVTGYGSEGFLPDAIAKRIIENIIKPAFREQQYYNGLNLATDAIISYGAGEYRADEQPRRESSGGFGTLIFLFIIFFIFILPMIQNYRNRNNKDDDDDGGFGSGGRYNERSRGGGGWIFLPPIGGGGGWTGGGSSGGGGGFGGFDGGFSGGGGAGGDW